jgi:hypothetical protein
MMRTSISILLSILLALRLQANAAELTLHMSPNGLDSANGLSETAAVATLQRALNLAENATAFDLTTVRIALQPGTYKAQRALTKGHPKGITIMIMSVGSLRSIFDGDGKGGTWLTLKPRGGESSNLKIIGLEVTNYETVIDVDGNRNNLKVWAGGMEIRDNYFHKIGDIAKTGAKPSTAAIRLVNSDKNIIKNNSFKNIKNTSRCVLLHALYVAHGSTDNIIEGNSFEDSCGDAVRFRDASDNNIVRKNTFIDAWARSPVSDWFCNQGQREDCTKASGECPSNNILIEDNKVVVRNNQLSNVFMRYGGRPSPNCGFLLSSPVVRNYRNTVDGN